MKKCEKNHSTVHDVRALSWMYNEGEDYISSIIKTVNPHMSPKEAISKLFPSAKVVVAVGDNLPTENDEWQCDENGCSFDKPTLSLQAYSYKVDSEKEVVTKVCCKPVITCPICLSQDVSKCKD